MIINTSHWNSLQLIADIINFEDNGQQLKYVLQNQPNWDELVKISSSHLLLPTIYVKLVQKNLISHVPKELATYLREITELNENRNLILLEEVREISQILTIQQIDFIFIKGVALLFDNIFSKHLDRMVGDIDILINPDQCQNAFEILQNHGYTKIIEFDYENKNFRHLPRQINKNKMGAVEIHSHVLNEGNKDLLPASEILARKKTCDGLNVPADIDNIRIAIYTDQINNHSYYFNTLNLKITYDVLSLIHAGNRALMKHVAKDKYTKKFLLFSSELFHELNETTTKQKKPFYSTLFVLSNTYPRMGLIMFKAKFAFLSIRTRIKLFLFNKSYRNHVITNKL